MKHGMCIVGIAVFCLAAALPARGEQGGCKEDSDCVPQQCCHPTTCGPKSSAPDCSGKMCTAMCQPNTLDCGGRCLCVEGTCQAQLNSTSDAAPAAAGAAKRCGGIAGVKCGEKEYCRFDDGSCGVADKEGLCAPIPQFCPMDFKPVCGCDGKTYSNACHAHAAGQNVKHTGDCNK